MLRPRLIAATLAAAALLALWNASSAAQQHKGAKVPDQPLASAQEETVGGTLEALTVRDNRHGASLRYYSLRQADGQRVGVKWLGADVAVSGATVQLQGRRSEGTFFVDRASMVSAPGATFSDTLPAGATRHRGTLEFLHADHFDEERCELLYVLKREDGSHLTLDLPVVPDILEEGMTLAVDGVVATDGLSLEPAAITIEPGADVDVDAGGARLAPAISGTTQVLVILIKYADTATEPYTQATIDGTVFSNTGSVANYFRESSYGRHTLAGTVTPWLTATFNRPTTCDYSRVGAEGMTLARNAGYNPANYQKFVYVFPSLPGCGWSGLGGGTYAWINQAASVLVIGHELGHTFGLGHAASLRCADAGVTSPVDGTCTRSEYGDAYAIMGNSRAAHLNAPHKNQIGYFTASEVKVHRGGTTTYTLAALEAPGGAAYAVKVPASIHRTYWLEWRQPIGFDAALGTGVTGGALVHTAYPSEWSCNTCLLDMTPATGTSFGDAALPVGQTFTDDTTRTTISVLSKTATALTVRVTTPTRPTYADVPATHVGYASIETLAWHGIALECGTNPLRFCPDRPVTRDEMAAFIERAKRGPGYAFTATGTRFADVPLTQWAAKYIEQLHIDGITTGCASNPLRYCPDSNVTRAQMAPFLLKGRWGSTFNPGTASGTLFADVPRTHSMAAWIERLYSYGVTAGCTASPRTYCPEATVTRAQMAIFLVRAFGFVAPDL